MMKNYVNEINNILYDYDIEGLADLGCPEDEYINEAELINKNINNKMSNVEIANICKDIFNQSFMTNYSTETFINISNEILKII